MKKLNMIIGLAVLSVVAQGCGALTDKQRGEFFDFLKDTAKTSATVESIARGQTGLVTEDTPRSDLRKRAAEVLATRNDCTAVQQDVGFRVPGADCPVSYETRGLGLKPEQKRSYTFKSWTLNNNALTAVVDTQALEWSVRSSKMDDGTVRFEFKGKITSKLHGVVPVDGVGQITKDGALDSRVNYGLKSFGADIVVKGDALTGELEYWVGGKRLEYADLMKQLGEGASLTQLLSVK